MVPGYVRPTQASFDVGLNESSSVGIFGLLTEHAPIKLALILYSKCTQERDVGMGIAAGARDALTRGLRMCGPSRSRGFRTTTATTRSIQRSMDEPSPFGKVFSLPPLSPLDRSQFVLYSPKDMRHTTQKLSLNLPVVSTVRPAPIQRRFSS